MWREARPGRGVWALQCPCRPDQGHGHRLHNPLLFFLPEHNLERLLFRWQSPPCFSGPLRELGPRMRCLHAEGGTPSCGGNAAVRQTAPGQSAAPGSPWSGHVRPRLAVWSIDGPIIRRGIKSYPHSDVTFRLLNALGQEVKLHTGNSPPWRSWGPREPAPTEDTPREAGK